jgi:hypothetical protein
VTFSYHARDTIIIGALTCVVELDSFLSSVATKGNSFSIELFDSD